MWTWLTRVVGNGKAATLLILLFIVILCVLGTRCAHADGELDFRAGTSFGPGGSGPVIGMQLYYPIGTGLDLYAGTLLWGATATVPNNWDWHTGFRTCRWNLCASLGASYLQRVDAVNGAHTNYNLELSYLIGWKRLASIDLAHLSDAGTTPVNLGRNAVLGTLRLQTIQP